MINMQVNPVMHPTGTCFDDALELLAFFIEEDKRRIETLVLVHGICLKPPGYPREGAPFAHAWLEEGDLVWSAAILDGVKVQFSCEGEDFRRQLRVQEATRYTPREASAENMRTNHYGPWVEKYRSLCKDAAA